MIIGFSIIFLVLGKNMADVSVQSMDNAITYYESTQRYNIASAGANFACAKIWENHLWRTGFTNVPFNNGIFTVTVTDTTLQRVKITSVGTYQGTNQTISLLMQPSYFSKFAYFSDNEPSTISWVTGDTVWGPFHSNTKLYYSGNPVFNGKVTTKNGKSGTGSPKFYGGYESGVDMTLPSNLDATKDSAMAHGRYLATTDTVWATFNADATITVKIGAAAATTTAISTYAPNGSIIFEGAILRLKGTVSGQVSIGTLTNGSGVGGRVFIDDDIVYKDDPRIMESTDLLGIIATKEIFIADNAANNTGDINIQAAMFSQTKGFGAEHYSTRPKAGSIKLLGGISQSVRQAVGTTGWPGTGFYKSYHYDDRLMSLSPPAYPITGSYEIVSWFE